MSNRNWKKTLEEALAEGKITRDKYDKVIDIRAQKKSLVKTSNLEPYFIVGLFDSEGCFYLGSDPNCKNRPYFTFALNIVDKQLVEALHGYFGIGFCQIRSATKTSNPAMLWQANTQWELTYVLKAFCDQYPLLGEKRLSYQLWRECLNILATRDQKSWKKKPQMRADLQQYREVMNPRGRDLKYTLDYVKKIFPEANYTRPPKLKNLKILLRSFKRMN
jgi:hypothetical protein